MLEKLNFLWHCRIFV